MITINGMDFPLDRKYYTKSGAHMWLKQDNGLVKIGLDAFASEMAGFLTFFMISEEEPKAGDAIGSFESAKFVSRFYSPISGKIVEVNEAAIANPKLINDDPYATWIVAIDPGNPEELASEFIIEDGGEIEAWITEEVKKLEEG
ncbi:MAG: glycine cleavage system protein H [Thermoplasmata archaeon]|nr:glycine cleavage system protein H [Thermoplasmata archaeon]